MVIMRGMLDYICAEPFRQFRLKVRDHAPIEIRYPEDISVGVTRVRVLTVCPEQPDCETWQMIPLESIESVEVLPESPAPSHR